MSTDLDITRGWLEFELVRLEGLVLSKKKERLLSKKPFRENMIMACIIPIQQK